MLNLDTDSFALVRSGRKTAHVLEGARTFSFSRPESVNVAGSRSPVTDPGGDADLVDGGPLPSLDVRVRRIEIKPLVATNEADAEACGFATFARFQEWVVSDMPDITPDSVVSIIHFERD